MVAQTNHQHKIGGVKCDQLWCSFDTSHQIDGPDDYQNQHTCAEATPWC